MSSTMITQPATTRASVRSRPVRLLALGKLVGLVMLSGVAAAIVVAAALGVVALLVSAAG